jgi:hypothetical protein
MLLLSSFQPPVPSNIPEVHALGVTDVGSVAPAKYWGIFNGTSGDVQINVTKPGIAVRIEIPREFLQGVIFQENDTHFIQSDIRNDYYYYSVVDEAKHWTYDWNRTASDGPCFKPNFSIYDPNAPWCVEIWNYLNGTFHNFLPPKFVRFHNLNAPTIAGRYNFTLFVADHINKLGYPDFASASSTTLFVPVSLTDNPATVSGSICDVDASCTTIFAKGVVYARSSNTGQIVARAYVNETTGNFTLSGLGPGSYSILASAGIFNGVAFSLSEPQSVQLTRGETLPGLRLKLKRAPQVCGTINYQNSTSLQLLTHSLTDHAYLRNIGFKVLNITVEAVDGEGHTFRYQNVSLNATADVFTIITGAGVKYVGTDPYGTEFAGLPPVDTGSYQVIVNVWISGYLREYSETATVFSAPGNTGPPFCQNPVSPNPVIMQTGAVISGTVEFRNTEGVETPSHAEASLEIGSTTDALFGGNILIRAYDHLHGPLYSQPQGIAIINGTLPDGRTSYAGSFFVRFYIVGFSEFYNRTWAGASMSCPPNSAPVTLCQGVKDYGLAEDTQGYTLVVSIRGYQEAATEPVSLPQGANQTVTIRMISGGAILARVFSFNNRFGTRVIQAVQPFRFLNLSIPVKARVYFYGSNGTVGYVERDMVLGGPTGVNRTSFAVLFAGQNWSLREIWFYGFVPTHITNDTYSVRAFTLGYVQQGDVTTPADLSSLSIVFVTLFLGNEISLTAPIFAEPALFWHTPERDFAIGEAFSSEHLIRGAVPDNLTEGTTTISLRILGFGAMVVNNAVFLGQGHFFYVPLDGSQCLYQAHFGFQTDLNHCFDYGLDVDNYLAQIPEFGFNKHFMTFLPSVQASFRDLFLVSGVYLDLVAMASIIQGRPTDLVSGWVAGSTTNQTMPLSWVRVDAFNQSLQRFVPTLDGQYDGVGKLNLPAGTYDIVFSVAFYNSQTQMNFQVIWNGTYSLLPPRGPLCPNADTSICSAFALAFSSSMGLVAFFPLAAGMTTRSYRQEPSFPMSVRSAWPTRSGRSVRICADLCY